MSPEVVRTYSTKIYKCENNYQKHCFVDRTGEVWKAIVPFVNELNQALFVKAVFFESNDFEFKAEIELKHRAQSLDLRNVSKIVKCFQGVCESVGLMHIPYVLYKSYIVEVRNLVPVASNVAEIQLQFINAQYSVYVILISICMIGMNLILLLLYLESGETFQIIYIFLISISVISFNIGVLLQFLLPFEGFWAYLANMLKIQNFFTVFFLYFIKVHWSKNTKYKYYYIIFESIVLGVYCWLRFQINIKLSGQDNYAELFRDNLNLNKELNEKLLILSGLTKLIFVWVLVLFFLLIRKPENSEEKRDPLTYIDLMIQLFTLLCTSLGSLSPAAPMTPIFFIFPYSLTIYIYIIQIQVPKLLPVFKNTNSMKPNLESSKLLELKLD